MVRYLYFLNTLMQQPKILISSGCSFTQVPNKNKNWPIFLSEKTNTKPFFDGAGCFGNDAIAKRTIYRLTECLKEYKPEEILVGVMWSGVSRKTIYSNTNISHITKFRDNDATAHYEFDNPNSIIKNGRKNIYSIHPQFNDRISNLYFENFYDDMGALIESLEHILRVQWFLKLNKINYFFTEYSHDCISGIDYKKFYKLDDVNHLINQLDYSNFLPIQNMYHWNGTESNLPYEQNDFHPTSDMSEAFVDRVILPFLKNKKIL